MKKVKVIVERGSDNKYSAYMDYYDFDFGLAGFGSNAKSAIDDFYKAYNEEQAMCANEGKAIPELEFEIQYNDCSFFEVPLFLKKTGNEVNGAGGSPCEGGVINDGKECPFFAGFVGDGGD